MKNPHAWRLDWQQRDTHEGVAEIWVAKGDMFYLRIEERDNDAVVGTVWKRIPATFWEPADIECVHEQNYDSVGEAKFLLEKLDADELRIEQENDAWLEA